jgi:hypothetical protein
MTSYEALIGGALAATAIHSPTSYTWFGRPGPSLTPEATAAIAPEAARSFLVYHLKMQLYADFYCPGGARPALETWDAQRPPSGRTSFLQELSDANTGRGSFEPGWTVRSLEPERVVVERDGLSLWATKDEVVAEGAGDVSVGSPVRVRLPKELFKLSPGFYMALGDHALLTDAGATLLRLYWHLEPRGAAVLVGSLTRACNEAGVPFRLKVVSQPEQYRRCDAAVLYIRGADYGQVAAIAEDAYALLAPDLRPLTPALTKTLAPGLGFAEDPGGQDSFGTHRCLAVAEGMVRAYERSASTPQARLEAVAESFDDAGLRLGAPFLNPGSSDRYALSGVSG